MLELEKLFRVMTESNGTKNVGISSTGFNVWRVWNKHREEEDIAEEVRVVMHLQDEEARGAEGCCMI